MSEAGSELALELDPGTNWVVEVLRTAKVSLPWRFGSAVI